MKKAKVISFNGRGISYRDAIERLAFTPSGKIILRIDKLKFRNGTLRIKRNGDRAIPVIMYEGESCDQLCLAFQARTENGEYITLDIHLIAEALTHEMQKRLRQQRGDQDE